MAGSSRVVVGREKGGEHLDQASKSKPWKLCLLVGSSWWVPFSERWHYYVSGVCPYRHPAKSWN